MQFIELELLLIAGLLLLVAVKLENIRDQIVVRDITASMAEDDREKS
jgi:hypothetical protein